MLFIMMQWWDCPIFSLQNDTVNINSTPDDRTYKANRVKRSFRIRSLALVLYVEDDIYQY